MKKFGSEIMMKLAILIMTQVAIPYEGRNREFYDASEQYPSV